MRNKKIGKSKQSKSEGLFIELTIAPKGAMVRPKSIIVRMERKSLENIRRALL